MIRRKSLVDQLTDDVVYYVQEQYGVSINPEELFTIIDNNIGAIVQIKDEQVIEVDIV